MDLSLSLLTSPWPVDRIWRAHQDGVEPTEAMDLRAGGICLEVRATGESVTLRTLEPSSYAFSDALARGLTLGEATGLALESHPSFDLAVAIQDLLERSLFADFTITPAEGGWGHERSHLTNPAHDGRHWHPGSNRLPPDIAAVMSTCFEIGCSTLLILGLATRLATLPLLGMILTIQLFVDPQAWPEHLVWGSILAFLLTRGPGALSLDRLIGIEPQDGPSS